MRLIHRRRRSYKPARATVTVMTLLAVLCATFVGAGVPAAAAQEDLSARLEAALGRVDVTVERVDMTDTPAARAGISVWNFVHRGTKGTLRIRQAASPGAAQALVVSDGPVRAVRINDVTGYAISTDTEAGQLGRIVMVTVNWARNDYWAEGILWGVTDAKDLLFVCEVVDSVLSSATGSDSGAGADPGVAVPPPVKPGLSASASPGSFTKLGDSVTVRVKLSGPEVDGKAVALVGHGLDLSATTDSGGGASFTVSHDDEALTEYRFTVTSEGMTRDVVIPVSIFDIHPEIEAVSGKPFAGVVADGRSALAIEIDLGTDTGGTLRVEKPELGTLGGSALGEGGGVALSGGKATIDYTPPAYLDASRLTERVTPPETSGPTIGSARGAQTLYVEDGSLWAANVPITFTHTAEDGRDTDVVVDVLVTRAPVLLLHGFGGGRATWLEMQSFLGGKGFDAVINEYYLGNQDIHDQARGLGADIAREKGRYASLGLKMSRVDLVAHSMGGLIARDYTYGFPPHPTDVRKIIMVGTPNHGASFFDKCLGNVMADVTAKHSAASEQLYSGSAFLAQLNAGESVGRHLNPDVQYGNIYGVRTDYVVPGSSAYLNGVAQHIIFGVTHSSDIPLPGVPITASDEVNGWVVEWLGADIPRAPLRATKAQVVDGAGDVSIQGIEAKGETLVDITSFPHDVQPWEHVATGSASRARIRLSVGGLAWGSIDLAPDTIIALGNLTPDSVTVRVRRGSARFRSLKREGGGHFEVVIGETSPGEWTTLHPDAKVIGLDTDFVVAAGEGGEAEALVLDGRALFDDGTAASDDGMRDLGPSQAGAVGVDSSYTSRLAREQWWTDGFYRPSFLEVLQEWWAILWSRFQAMAGG